MKYTKVREQISSDFFIDTYTRKERQCDMCSSMKNSKHIGIIKYPIIDKYLGRVIMTKQVCIDCYSDVKEIINSLKYN